MSIERYNPLIREEAINVEEERAQFTQAGSPSSFSIEDFAKSLPDDNLRKMLSGIKPLRQKGKPTLGSEQTHKMPIEILTFRLYWIEGCSLEKIAQEYGTSIYQIRNIMIKAGIPRRGDIVQLNSLYRDPNRREEFIAKTHTPEANKKRREARSRWFKNHPEAAMQFGTDMLKKRREKANFRGREIHDTLGAYPHLALIRLHYIEGYSVGQISENTGLEESRLRTLMKKYKIRNLDEPTKAAGKKSLDIGSLVNKFYNREVDLSPNQEYVIYRRYIEPEYRQLNLEDIGHELGVKKQRVKQLEKRTMEKLSIVSQG